MFQAGHCAGGSGRDFCIIETSFHDFPSTFFFGFSSIFDCWQSKRVPRTFGSRVPVILGFENFTSQLNSFAQPRSLWYRRSDFETLLVAFFRANRGTLMILAVFVILVVTAVVLIGMYNSLVRLRVRCDSAWSDIDVQLKRRHDLIPSLVETVRIRDA
jgi:hypothetical protein